MPVSRTRDARRADAQLPSAFGQRGKALEQRLPMRADGAAVVQQLIEAGHLPDAGR